MVLSDKEIASAMRKGELDILPRGFRINPAGIDLRIDREVRLEPKQHSLVASIERVELSDRFVGFLHLRSSLAREGLFASLALVVPGFRGHLTHSRSQIQTHDDRTAQPGQTTVHLPRTLSDGSPP